MKDGEWRTAVIYTRVSTREQAERDGEADGYSLAAQVDGCRRKAESLGLVIIEEYCDRGESAKSADRPALQEMLERIRAKRDVGYVIVHKVDRLARNRTDDVTINLALKAAGVTLISCTESIDETPSGMLLHGIMASIAEFYSRNLAGEVMKGLNKKVEGGGTPHQAPLGYVHVRTGGSKDGLRSVEPDPDRAPLISWAYEEYATGQWTVRSLLEELTKRGLKSKGTRRYASRPLCNSQLHKVLSNPYYKGVVTYMGVEYAGKHQPLVSPELWQRVQDMLALKANGEKQREHPHYLKSTLWCGYCGSRIGVTYSKGRGGTYPYFMCVGRHSKRTDCTFRSRRIEVVEEEVIAYYRRVRLHTEGLLAARDVLSAELAKEYEAGEAEEHRQRERITHLRTERKKLMDAHYAGAVPLDLLKEEQTRINQEMVAAEAVLGSAQASFEQVQATLDGAMRQLPGGLPAGDGPGAPPDEPVLLLEDFHHGRRHHRPRVGSAVLALAGTAGA